MPRAQLADKLEKQGKHLEAAKMLSEAMEAAAEQERRVRLRQSQPSWCHPSRCDPRRRPTVRGGRRSPSPTRCCSRARSRASIPSAKSSTCLLRTSSASSTWTATSGPSCRSGSVSRPSAPPGSSKDRCQGASRAASGAHLALGQRARARCPGRGRLCIHGLSWMQRDVQLPYVAPPVHAELWGFPRTSCQFVQSRFQEHTHEFMASPPSPGREEPRRVGLGGPVPLNCSARALELLST